MRKTTAPGIAALAAAIILAVTAHTAPTKQLSFAPPSADEFTLHRLVNEYRAAKGLPALPLSRSLTHVARVHARDAQENPPSPPCNGHSWSDKGGWTACCYTPDHARARCMWDKPKELTNYPGNGYECGHWSSAGAAAESSLRGWKSSPPHNAVLINRGKWSSIRWKCLGVGIHGNWAFIWFGDRDDPDGYWEDGEG